MTLHIEEHKYVYHPTKTGLFYYPMSTDNPSEVLDFFKSFTGNKSGGIKTKSGWIKTPWEGTVHFTAHSDNKGAVFTDAIFTKGDRDSFYNLIGEEATNLLLRHHNIKN